MRENMIMRTFSQNASVFYATHKEECNRFQ